MTMIEIALAAWLAISFVAGCLIGCAIKRASERG
ncbi:hypothetical protein C8K11_12021 [Novosphingobium sp. GV055]|nr:hypothetical protein C8K11_12021 [Novosphingobium sp. GV055]PUA94827.1 hypothetical protein C8K12_12021 [Novosphingobium sp. GV061]PUB13752.1 hypothetical protein C8K14_12021 [Novosphingobium sp. GV079]PUB38450.1 hypothetical protein C8K10_12021 [Novosphingobium sp. GV027]